MTEPFSNASSSVNNINDVVDKPAREKALDPSESIICEAPAGSGKTELLTQRFLCLLARVEKPEEILAITFTRKAAGEMRERILKSLYKAATQPEPEAEHEKVTWKLAAEALRSDQRYKWNLIQNPNRLHISTFDSVCAGLANSLPWHSQFLSPPEVLDDAKEVYREAARSMLASVEVECAWQQPLKTILSSLDNNTQKLERLFITILQRRESWLPLLGADQIQAMGEGGDSIGPEAASEGEAFNQEAQFLLNDLLAQIAQQTIEQILQRIPEDLAKSIVEHVSFAAHNLQGTKQAIVECENLDLNTQQLPGWDEEGVQQWKSIIGLFFTATNTWRKTVNKNNGFPPGDNAEEKKAFKEKKQSFLTLIESLKTIEGIDALFTDVLHLPSFHYDAQQGEFLFSLFQVLPTLSAMLTVEFRQKNCVDFSEISLRASEALGDLDSPSELALALDYKLRHILVDEFQDTSPSQIRLLTRLTSGWEPEDQRTLFCVGDAMQSIYGFRGANVGLFLHCLQHGLGEVPLFPIKLRTNFRSQSSVVDWVNNAFDFAFPQLNDITDGAVSYSHSHPFNTRNEDSGVTTHLLLSESDAAKATHDEYVVDLVANALEEGSSSIAILVRGRSDVLMIAPLLAERGIRFRAVDLDPLQDKPEISDLIALTLALFSEANRVAWYSILRAPWCGLSLVDLEAIARFLDVNESVEIEVNQDATLAPVNREQRLSAKNLSLWSQICAILTSENSSQLSEDGLQRLQKFASVLKVAMENSYRKHLRQWVEGTWLALQGPATLANPSALNNVTMYFELLEKLDDGSGVLNEVDLQSSVEKLFASADPNADGTVQIMTIHKSKGLEFDTVIIPAVDKKGRADNIELLSWYERVDDSGGESIVLAPIKASGVDSDSISQHVQYQLKKKARYESCRLLYVACTRAKRRLHLVANANKTDKGEWKAPAKNALLAHIFDFVIHSNTTRVVDRRSLEDDLDKQEHNSEASAPALRYDQSLLRLPLSYTPKEMEPGYLLEKYIPYYGHENLQEDAQEEGGYTVDGSLVADNPVDDNLTDDNPVDDKVKALYSESSAEAREHSSAAWAPQVGTLVHEILHNAASFGWRDVLFQSSMQNYVWTRRLRTLGVDNTHLPEAVNALEQLIENIQTDHHIHWMLRQPHDQLLSEYLVRSASLQPPEEINENIIDLVIVDKGATWLIDFKTSAPYDGVDVEQFLAKEKMQYLDVMRRYANLLHSLEYQNIRAGLYFPAISRWASYSSNEIRGVIEEDLPRL